jgi:hypothetical protein
MANHGGTNHEKGVLHKTKPQPRVYANHGGTNSQQGRVHDAPTRGGAVNRGGTFGMGTLKKRK